MSEVKDINAIEALLEVAEKLALAGLDIKEDGIGAEDIPTAVALLSNIGEIISAFKGVGEAFKEAKDIDAEEAIAIVGKLYEMGKKIELALREE